MATNYTCDLCNETAADFVITLILNGETMAVGVECVEAWAETVTAGIKAAAARDENATGAAPVPPSDTDPDWEGGYPQGRESEEPGGSEGEGVSMGTADAMAYFGVNDGPDDAPETGRKDPKAPKAPNVKR